MVGMPVLDQGHRVAVAAAGGLRGYHEKVRLGVAAGEVQALVDSEGASPDQVMALLEGH